MCKVLFKLKAHTTCCIPTVYLNVSSFFMTEVERFDEEYITVMLKRIPESDDSLFNYISANSTPRLDIWFNETKTSKMRINYNISYNLSVSAVVCDHVVATTHLELHFGESDKTYYNILTIATISVLAIQSQIIIVVYYFS